MPIEPEKHEFQTEVRELLNLMIHSLYSHKEVFVRELISNAADALDKLRFQALTDQSLLGDKPELRIDIRADETAKTIIIEDSGIGMSKEDLVSNLGTIARSGTKAFMKSVSGDQKKDVSLIGQFGVGFYSVFMVAKKVEVLSRKAGTGEAWIWESEGQGEYDLRQGEKSDRGTKITIYLNEDEDCSKYASSWEIKSLVRKYSEFITHPIWLWPSLKEITDKRQESDDAAKRVADARLKAVGKPADSQEAKDVADEENWAKRCEEEAAKASDPEQLNGKGALWRQSPKDITPDQYKEFYKTVASDSFNDPAAWTHSHSEGTQEFWSLAYVPSKAPFGLYQNEKSHGVKLYVKRVFIMDDCKELMPSWLRFVRGVVDSEDLPLNVSREILQNNRVIQVIRKHTVKKVLESLKDMADNRVDDYTNFWKELGAVLKEGFYMNYEWLDELKELLRFTSTMTEAGKYVSLKDYAGRMKEGQKEIYYLIAENAAAAAKSPHLEAFKAKGYEVILMSDPVDEFMMQNLRDYTGKTFKDIGRGQVELEATEEEKKAAETAQKDYEGLCQALLSSLSASVESVRVTTRLKDSPACLIRSEHAMGAQMEKLMAQMGDNGMGMGGMPSSKRILEINPEHAIIRKLKDKTATDIGEWPIVLYGQALLAEGSPLVDPGAYVSAVTKLLS